MFPTNLNLYNCIYSRKNGTREFIKNKEIVYKISCKYVSIVFEDCECKLKLKLIFDNCWSCIHNMLLKNVCCKPEYIRYSNYDKLEKEYFPEKFIKKVKYVILAKTRLFVK